MYQGDGEIDTLFRYIHQNPVKAGIVETVEDYPLSRWHEYVSDKGRANAICETSFMLDQVVSGGRGF